MEKILNQPIIAKSGKIGEQTMSDLIKRSDAIKALDNAWINGTSLLDANEAVKQLKDLPSVDRPQGEWIFVENFMGINRYKCSVCEREELLTYLKNFCSNCGAMMKGADDE